MKAIIERDKIDDNFFLKNVNIVDGYMEKSKHFSIVWNCNCISCLFYIKTFSLLLHAHFLLLF
jgi:hypothetical protein